MASTKSSIPFNPERYGRISRAAVRSVIRAKAGYPLGSDRIGLLRRLLPLTKAELGDNSRTASTAIVERLRSALRNERRQGKAGHWTYDLNRHIALSQALNTEIQRLKSRSRKNNV